MHAKCGPVFDFSTHNAISNNSERYTIVTYCKRKEKKEIELKLKDIKIISAGCRLSKLSSVWLGLSPANCVLYVPLWMYCNRTSENTSAGLKVRLWMPLWLEEISFELRLQATKQCCSWKISTCLKSFIWRERLSNVKFNGHRHSYADSVQLCMLPSFTGGKNSGISD